MPATVYIETTIIGHLTSRLPRSEFAAGQMLATRKWWDESRKHFDLYTSDIVRREITQGDPTAAAERLEIFRTLPLLDIGDSVAALALRLVEDHALPAKALTDATHLAVAATNGIDYLLTWNCKHLANATLRTKIEKSCLALDFTSPIICTPYELEEVPP